MTGFPTKTEILSKTPSGLVALLDSVLGPGYDLTLQLSRGLRWRGAPGNVTPPLFEAVDTPPIFPVRVRVTHIKGQDRVEVRWDIKIRGQFIDLEPHRLEMDGVYYGAITIADNPPWGTTLYHSVSFELDDPIIYPSIQDFADFFLRACKEYARIAEHKNLTDPRTIELVAATSNDLAEVVKANLILKVKIDRLRDIQQEAERRIRILALGGEPPEDKDQ